MPNEKTGTDDPKSLKEKVEERVAAEEEAYPTPENSNGTVSSKFIKHCIGSNELGDGLLYAAINKDRFIYNNATSEWFAWSGHHWIRDEMEESLTAVEHLVDRLLEETETIGGWITQAIKGKQTERQQDLEKQRENIMKRIFRLRADKGRNACLKFARTCRDPLAIRGDELDLHPWLLPCQNGVVDLQTGTFRDGRPDEYLSLASPVSWKDLKEPAPEWERFILEILDEDKDLSSYTQRLLGYGITGQNVEHILPVLWGSGRNGKGKMVEVLNYVLGPLSGSIQSELLLDQRRPRSSVGPSPDIMSLKGLRLAFASETDEGQRFSAAKVKWLTGGDQLVGRYPHDKHEIRFTPTHTLFLMTNHKPHAAADDLAFWERVHLIPFRLAFVDREPSKENERKADKYIAEKLKQEASGILAWLVRGCIQYQKEGLKPPRSVIEATAEYRRAEDILADFIEDHCIVDPEMKGQASELYDRFTEWYKDNVSKRGTFSQRKFGTILGKRFEKKKTDGVVYYMGIALDYSVERGEGSKSSDVEF